MGFWLILSFFLDNLVYLFNPQGASRN